MLMSIKQESDFAYSCFLLPTRQIPLFCFTLVMQLLPLEVCISLLYLKKMQVFSYTHNPYLCRHTQPSTYIIQIATLHIFIFKDTAFFPKDPLVNLSSFRHAIFLKTWLWEMCPSAEIPFFSKGEESSTRSAKHSRVRWTLK